MLSLCVQAHFCDACTQPSVQSGRGHRRAKSIVQAFCARTGARDRQTAKQIFLDCYSNGHEDKMRISDLKPVPRLKMVNSRAPGEGFCLEGALGPQIRRDILRTNASACKINSNSSKSPTWPYNWPPGLILGATGTVRRIPAI